MGLCGGGGGGAAVITRTARVRMGWMSTIRLAVIVEDTGGRLLQLNLDLLAISRRR